MGNLIGAQYLGFPTLRKFFRRQKVARRQAAGAGGNGRAVSVNGMGGMVAGGWPGSEGRAGYTRVPMK